MQITIDVDKVLSLMKEKGFVHYKDLWAELKDVHYQGFYKVMKQTTKHRTHLHMTVRIAQALKVPVEEIIKEIP